MCLLLQINLLCNLWQWSFLVVVHHRVHTIRFHIVRFYNNTIVRQNPRSGTPVHIDKIFNTIFSFQSIMSRTSSTCFHSNNAIGGQGPWSCPVFNIFKIFNSFIGQQASVCTLFSIDLFFWGHFNHQRQRCLFTSPAKHGKTTPTPTWPRQPPAFNHTTNFFIQMMSFATTFDKEGHQHCHQ